MSTVTLSTVTLSTVTLSTVTFRTYVVCGFIQFSAAGLVGTPHYAAALKVIGAARWHPRRNPSSRVWQCGHFPALGGGATSSVAALRVALESVGVPCGPLP